MGQVIDKVKGVANEVAGRAKQASGDAETRAKGVGQEVKGRAQQLKGDIKGAINKL